MHKRRPKAMRGKGIKRYCRMIEKKNMKLRQLSREIQQGAGELQALLNAILAAVVEKFGDFDIEVPKIGKNVKVEKRDDRLYISSDTQRPDICGETKCQEGTSMTHT